MFVKLEDHTGDVCVNMDTGLRFRPLTVNGLPGGIVIIFPDGSTTLKVRGDYERLANTLKAVSGRV